MKRSTSAGPPPDGPADDADHARSTRISCVPQKAGMDGARALHSVVVVARDAAESAVRTFRRSVRATMPAVEVLRAAAGALGHRVPADFSCAVLLDPATLLDTGGVHDSSFPDEVLPRMFEIEHVDHEGADNLRALVARRATVSVLSESARDELPADTYYRDILRPLGMSDEMRVVLRHGPYVWGLLVWCRSGSAGFSAGDVAVARGLAAPVADAVRASLALEGADLGDLPDAPGLTVVDGDHTIISSSPTAERWLNELQESGVRGTRTPNTLRALVSHSMANPERPARSCAFTRTGRWAALHAWPLDGGRTAVSVGPAGLNDLIAVVLDVYGLTVREREVTEQVLRGRSTKQIAASLHMSAYTVQDHLRAVFEKAGVGSRRELMSTIFTRHYQPRLGAAVDDGLVTDGRRRADRS